MLPQLSSFSVRYRPAGRLRHRYSSGSLRISPLHPEFYLPLRPSSSVVSDAPSQLSQEISQPTCRTAYRPFTPSDSEQRLPPTYYRGCWHVVSRGFLYGYRQTPKSHSSPSKGVYTPKGFILHAASLRQGFPHCARVLTAASRRSLDRVSVPVWPTILSDRLSVSALVSRYLTNKLIERGPLLKHPKVLLPLTYDKGRLCGISSSFPELFPTRGQVIHAILTRAPRLVPESEDSGVQRSTCMC